MTEAFITFSYGQEKPRRDTYTLNAGSNPSVFEDVFYSEDSITIQHGPDQTSFLTIWFKGIPEYPKPLVLNPGEEDIISIAMKDVQIDVTHDEP